jgi:hypothetical protein
MKRFFQGETIGFLLIWGFLMAYGSQKLFRDPGTFWHLAVGQHILATHHFMSTDIFSFTFQGQPWVAHQWLMECLMARLNAAAGLDGLLILTATSLAMLYTWLLRRLLNGGLHPLLAALVLGMALAASSHHFHARPHVISIICFALTYAWLVDFEARRVDLKGMLWLLPLFLLWSNSHGAVLGGLATFFLAICGWGAARLLRQESPLDNWKEAALLAALFLGCALTALVNPYGWELPRTWLAIMRSPAVSGLIQEHASAFRTGDWTVVMFGVIYLAALAGTKWPRVTWLLPVVWFGLALSRVRHGPLFAAAALLALAEMFPEIRWARWLAARGSVCLGLQPVEPEGRRLTATNLLIPALAVATAILVSQIGLPGGRPPGQRLVRLDPKHWPVELLPELKAYEKSHPPGTPIFNDFRMGGFLIYYTPGLRVFVDDRCELYGDDFLFPLLEGDPERIEDWAKRYGFEMALTQAGSNFDRYLRRARGWRLVREAAAGSLYQRVGKD